MSELNIAVEDGKLFCSFIREAVTDLVLPGNFGEVTIDLDNVSYFVELATGPLASNGYIAPHQDAGVSDNPVKM